MTVGGEQLAIVGADGSAESGAFTSMLVGSVSLYCVTHAYCLVTVVRAPGRH